MAIDIIARGMIESSKNDISQLFDITKGGADVGGESSYTIENAVDYQLLGLNLYGKSTQDGVPTPENPVEIVSVGDNGNISVQSCGKNLFDYTLLADTAYNGVTFKNNNDGTFTISGEKNDISKSFISSVNLSHEESIGLFPSGNYTISGFPNKWGLHANIGLFYNGKMYNSVANTVNNPTLTITKDILTDDFNVSISVYSASNNQITVGTFYLQIEKGSIATDFEPYNGATANITSALPLCGIPVDSGGNYTDSNGQQWVCDELVYNADGTGKVVKRIDVTILDGSEKWYATNAKMTYCEPNAKWASHDELLKNDYRVISKYHNKIRIDENYVNVHLDAAMENYQTWLQNNPFDIYFVRKIPQEVELTAAEMTALRQLQTFNGTTSISNDGGADMDITYCTNKTLSEYVMPITTGLQKQIDELKAAVLSLGGNV